MIPPLVPRPRGKTAIDMVNGHGCVMTGRWSKKAHCDYYWANRERVLERIRERHAAIPDDLVPRRLHCDLCGGPFEKLEHRLRKFCDACRIERRRAKDRRRYGRLRTSGPARPKGRPKGLGRNRQRIRERTSERRRQERVAWHVLKELLGENWHDNAPG